jgi:MHS family proline/betaine transporter-like MFS transporter
MNYQTKTILAGFIGNLVESYDIAICYFLASDIARVIMGNAQGDPRVVFMLILIAYLMKPIGAFLLGLCSDRFGRKKIFVTSIVTAGLATALIGLIPSYQTLGFTSVAFLFVLRAAQSIAIGSEFLNSSSFLVESGDHKQRGFRGCWSSVGVKAGSILACICAGLVHASDRPFDANAWRIPFLLAAVTTGIGFLMRYRMPESLSYILYYANRPRPSTRAIYQQSFYFMKQYPFLFRYAFVASVLSVASSFFFYLYMPVYAVHHAHLPQSFVTVSTLLSLTLTAALIPLFGWLSDQRERLTIIRISTAGILMLSYPFMLAMTGKTSFLCMQLLIAIPCAAYYSVCSVVLTELFPMPIRCTTLSIIFSLAASLAAGVPPVLSEALIYLTHSPDSPSLIIIMIAAVLLYHINRLGAEYHCGQNTYRNLPMLRSYG